MHKWVWAGGRSNLLHSLNYNYKAVKQYKMEGGSHNYAAHVYILIIKFRKVCLSVRRLSRDTDP